ncbi:MAG: metallohydrolase [Rhizomicrobium sp.]
MLRERLPKDAQGRTYVDSFLLSHPDADHCRGLARHFHLGKPDDWKKDDDKVFIREMWSSPIIFRRSSELDGELCDDANAWWTEARRRVAKYRENKNTVKDGDRIQILGADVDGKTDDLADIKVDIDGTIEKICGQKDNTFKGLLLAPLPSADKDEEEALKKNHSSVVIRFHIKAGSVEDACAYLTGGDAEVAIWERLWKRHKKTTSDLTYDVLLTPHHCSWHTLSYDSWSDMGEDAKVAPDARSALSQANDKAIIVASSKEIKNDEDDPPCIRAKREYDEIVKDVSGQFLCTATDGKDDVILIEIDSTGPAKKAAGGGAVGGGSSSGKKPGQVEKKGGGRYA